MILERGMIMKKIIGMILVGLWIGMVPYNLFAERVLLEWEGNPQLEQYMVEISSDNRFQVIDETLVVDVTQLEVNLEDDSMLYIRISGIHMQGLDEEYYIIQVVDNSEEDIVYYSIDEEGNFVSEEAVILPSEEETTEYDGLNGWWEYQNLDAFSQELTGPMEVFVKTNGNRIYFYPADQSYIRWQGMIDSQVLKVTWEDGVMYLLADEEEQSIVGIWERNNGNLGMIEFHRP